MDELPYIRNVKNLNHLATELKKITNDYWIGKVSETTLKSYIHYVASNTRLLTDNGKDINITVKLAIGKKRTALVMKMLENYQLRLF